MELRQLEYFVAAASEMNFSRAAQRVHVVQSALSMSIAKLEKELGVELFDRSKQQIKITPAGELFRDRARHVIHSVRLAKDSISEHRGSLTGVVELGCIVTSGSLDVPKIVGDFHRRYPSVRIRLRQSQSGSRTYLSAIADGTLDLALVTAPARASTGVELHLLTAEPMMFVCRPDHPLAQRAHVTIGDLAEEELTGFPAEFGLQRIVDDAFAAAGITLHKPYEAAVDYAVGASLVRNGLGSIFMPTSDADHFADLRAIPMRPAMTSKVYLATRTPPTPASARLAELLHAAAGEVSAH